MIIYKVDAEYIYLGYQVETIFIPILQLKPIDVLNLQELCQNALFDWHKLTKKYIEGGKPH
jgi:hypothetical protein